MGLTQKVAHWQQRLKLGSHHRIERFGIMFTALVSVFALLVGVTAFSAYRASQEDLSATAIYTPEFTSSLSEITGSVPGVYTSPDKHRAMIMMEFDNADEAGFSTNAENYEAFVGAVTPQLQGESVSTNINGNVVMFGSSGYMGVVLTSDEPFDEQILGVTLRNNATSASSGDGTYEDQFGDESFAEHDQWRVFVNPGASETTELQALEGRGVEVEQIYSDVVLNPREEAMRSEMNSQLAAMQEDLGLISELENEMDRTNVDGVRIIAPEIPEEIAGDRVTGELGEVSDFTHAETDVEAEELDTTLPGSYPDSTLALETDWVDPRGFDFDWRSTSLMDGYLDELVPEDESYYSFLENKALGIASGESPETDEEGVVVYDPEDEDAGFDSSEIEWETTDGVDLTEQSEIGPGMDPLVTLMNNLTQAYQDYYDDKVLYQVDLHTHLLEMELELSNVSSSYSINNDDDAVQILG